VVDVNKNLLKIYPNPGNGIYTLEFSNQIIKRVKVTDLNGRSVFEKNNLSVESFQLDLSYCPDGMYLLYIEEADSGAVNPYKLIKQNGGK
jgi:hypothetical protein